MMLRLLAKKKKMASGEHRIVDAYKPVGWAEHDALAIASATFRVGKTG